MKPSDVTSTPDWGLDGLECRACHTIVGCAPHADDCEIAVLLTARKRLADIAAIADEIENGWAGFTAHTLIAEIRRLARGGTSEYEPELDAESAQTAEPVTYEGPWQCGDPDCPCAGVGLPLIPDWAKGPLTATVTYEASVDDEPSPEYEGYVTDPTSRGPEPTVFDGDPDTDDNGDAELPESRYR